MLIVVEWWSSLSRMAVANEKNAERLKAEAQSMNEAIAEDTRRAKSAILAVHYDKAPDPMILSALADVQLALQSQTASMIDLAKGGDWRAVQLRLATERHRMISHMPTE